MAPKSKRRKLSTDEKDEPLEDQVRKGEKTYSLQEIREKLRDRDADLEVEDGFTFIPSKERSTENGKTLPTLYGLSLFHLAIVINDLPTVSRILTPYNADTASGQPQRINPLGLASLFSRKEIVQKLFENEARICVAIDTNARPSLPRGKKRSTEVWDEKTAAVYRKEAEEALLKMLTTWDETDGSSFLHSYCGLRNKQMNEKLIRNLIAFGLSLNLLNDKKQTPLHSLLVSPIFGSSAITRNQRVSFLFKNGANISLRDEEGNTPLMLALERREAIFVSMKILQKLIPFDKDALNALNTSGDSALSLAIKSNGKGSQLSFLTILVTRGADVHWKSSDGKCLIRKAIEENGAHADLCVKRLLKNGAKPDIALIRDHFNFDSYNDCLHLLLDSSQELKLAETFPDILTFVGKYLNRYEMLPILKKLIEEHKVDPNFIGTDMSLIQMILKPQKTPGYTELYHNRIASEIVKYLLRMGLIPRLEDIRFALKYNSHEVILLLLEFSKDLDLKTAFPNALLLIISKTWYYSEEGRSESLLTLIKKLVIDFGFSPNYQNENKAVLIEVVKRREQVSLLCLNYFLTIKDIDLNVYLNDETPFSAAFACRHYKVALKLIENFVDVTKATLTSRAVFSGFSFILMLAFYGGYRFPAALRCRPHYSYQGWNEEKAWFEKWLQEKSREVFSLRRMAGNKVRRAFGEQVTHIFENVQLPGEVKSILLLNYQPEYSAVAL